MNKPVFDPTVGAQRLDTVTANIAMTGTGLDTIVKYALIDPGLNQNIEDADIIAGARAAAEMNAIVIQAIKAMGAANDGEITANDVYALADWISANRRADWIRAHGDDENNVETGFHKIQSDGNALYMFGDKLLDQVADGIYHLGFGYENDRLINEDSNSNARVEEVAYWLNELLAEDLADGTLKNNAVSPEHTGSTGTGLDTLVDIINDDPGLERRLPASEIKEGAAAADAMNKIIVDGIKATGIANDGQITKADVKDLSDWIYANRKAAWIAAHGDDENDKETAFHLVQNDGSQMRLFGHDAVDTVADGLYHLGFGHKDGRVINEDGNKNASLESVAYWLEELLADDLANGSLADNGINLHPEGTTGTAFDEMTQLVTTDLGLIERYTASELKKIAEQVDDLNAILIDAITETGVANDGSLTAKDLAVVGKWIEDNAQARWASLRGNEDKDVSIMGLVWNGGVGELGNTNAFNELARGMYSLGFGTKHGGIRDQNGDWKGSLEDLAGWMNAYLADDLLAATFYNPAQDPVDPASFANDIIASVEAVAVRDNDNYAVINDTSALRMDAGTIAFTFTANEPYSSNQVLFAKDGKGSNDGDMRMYLHEGELHVKVSMDDKDHFLKIEGKIKAGHPHDVAVSFDGGAISIWVDGIREVYRDDFDYDMRTNTSDIIVGASNGSQEGNEENINAEFQGQITGFAVYDRVLEQGEVQGLSQGVRKSGNSGDNNIAGSDGDDALYGGLGRDAIKGGDGDDFIDGGYDADTIDGGAGNDIIFAGEGQDSVNGGAGNDIIIVESDGREPQIGQLIYGSNGRVRDDNGWVDFQTLTIYPEQPIPADDVLIGGEGADTFRFQWNINAKDYIIEKHVRKDGSINWAGVAGENTYLHDHWVDTIGNDRIMDFSKAEGDRIEVAGHTLTFDGITYRDVDGDGTEESIIAYKSNQGNGGAHDQDKLGTITVFGDRVVKEDIYQLPSKPVVYGVVENIKDLEEAVTPLSIDPGTSRNMPTNLNTSEVDGPRGTPETGPVAKADAAPKSSARSGTGLDTILDWIETDPGLADRTDAADITKGSAAAAEMNAIIIKHIKKLGIANDGEITAADVMALATSIRKSDYKAWVKAHGDDENDVETGFHLVQNDGAKGRAFGENGINTVADGLYHLGFGYNKHLRLINEDGNSNASVESVAHWLNELLADDMDDLANAKVSPLNGGSTGTGLDKLVDIINEDPGLQRKVSLNDIKSGANGADVMNEIIVQSIKATGVANDGRITASDVATLSEFIKKNHSEMWTWAHGDDEDNVETTFHRVQSDGGETRLNGHAAIDTVADGIYHLGFGHKEGHLLNEDGKRNASLSDVASWMEDLLAEELANGRLANANTGPYLAGTTGTGLDALVEMVATDEGLLSRISTTEISKAARSADGLNKILLKAIKETGVANDGKLDEHDIKIMDAWIAKNEKANLDRYNGTESDTKRTGFEIAELWSSTSPLFGENGVNTVADSIYSIGYGTKHNGAIANRDGKWQAELTDVADWLNRLLKDDMQSGALFSAKQKYTNPSAFADDIVYDAPRDVVGNGQGGYVNVKHTSAMALSNATVSFNFKANSLPNDKGMTLFSKDGKGNGDGHTELYFWQGELYVRMQTADKSHYLKVTERGALQTGATYAIALVLGDKGLQVFIDGEQVASNLEIDMNWKQNDEDIVIGGSGNARKPGEVDPIHSGFDGTITDFAIYDRALDFGEISGLAGVNTDITPANGTPVPDLTPVEDPVEDDDDNSEAPAGGTPAEEPQEESNVEEIMEAADDTDTLGTGGGSKTGSAGTDVYIALAGKNDLDGAGGNDLLIGGFMDDTLEGGAGNDALLGDLEGAVFGGDDLLIGGRGDDMLKGGKGADIFGFSTNDGDDIIADFSLNFTNVGSDNGFKTTPTGADFEVGVDKIQLSGFSTVTEGNVLTSGALRQTADGTEFDAEGTTILLYGVNLNTISESDFAFV